MSVLLAVVGGGSMFEVAKWVIILLAVVAVVWIVCKAIGVTVPWWLVQILIVVAVAAIAIIAVGFLVSL